MAIYYNNDAKLLMDIKPNAVPFAGEDIVVPILTAMTAGERETCMNGFVDIMGMNERHKERNGELYHAIRNFGKAMNLHCSRPPSPEETEALKAHFGATIGKKAVKPMRKANNWVTPMQRIGDLTQRLFFTWSFVRRTLTNPAPTLRQRKTPKLSLMSEGHQRQQISNLFKFYLNSRVFEPQRFNFEGQRFGLEANRFGLESQRFGLEPQRFGLTFHRFGLAINRSGLAINRFGLAINRFGLTTQ